MKKRNVFLLGLLVVLLAMGLVLAGCGDDGSGDNGGSNSGGNNSGGGSYYYNSGAELSGTTWRCTDIVFGVQQTRTITFTSSTTYTYLRVHPIDGNDGPWPGTFTLSGNNISVSSALLEGGSFTSKTTLNIGALVFTKQ